MLSVEERAITDTSFIYSHSYCIINKRYYSEDTVIFIDTVFKEMICNSVRGGLTRGSFLWPGKLL